jgi:transcriptional regulator with XRE-family HTH domain
VPYLYNMETKPTIPASRAAEQARACWAHYIRGWSIQDIANELGIVSGTVSKYLREAQATAKAERDKLASDFLQRELDHLDALERTLEADLAGDEGLFAPRRASAVKLLLDIKARRAKYLGLDKPTEVKHSLTLEDLVAGAAKPE